jgi:hypothetical protein
MIEFQGLRQTRKQNANHGRTSGFKRVLRGIPEIPLNRRPVISNASIPETLFYDFSAP